MAASTGTVCCCATAEASRDSWEAELSDQGTKGVADAQLAAMRWTVVPESHGIEQAAHWYQMAADQGNADAQFALGNLYTKGDGVPKSEPEAIKWYQKAAAQGHAKARRELSWRGIKS